VPLQQVSGTVPIVFANVTDPVGAGIVANLARPGANTTGFTHFEYGLSAKWLELLKQIAPGTTRAAVLRDSTLIASMSQFAAIQSVAPSLGVELMPIDTRNAGDIERSVATFARETELRADRRDRHLGDHPSRWRPGTECPRSTRFATTPPAAA
jgi:putative ABC transport system substrate-binding protein